MNSATKAPLNRVSLNLEQVWAEYQQALKSFLHSKVNNTADVDDLLQESLIKTYQNLDKAPRCEQRKIVAIPISQSHDYRFSIVNMLDSNVTAKLMLALLFLESVNHFA